MNLISLADWPKEPIEEILGLALDIKQKSDRYTHALPGKILLMIFQKPSLRTRLSFEAAMLQLGGHAMFYDLGASPWGAGKESLSDSARTASRYVHGIMARLFSPADMEELGRHATVPVINGLTDFEHPCQALGDLLTIQEKKGRLQGLKLTFLGDGQNNVAHSLLDASAQMGMNMTIGCPTKHAYQPATAVLARARTFGSESGARIEVRHDPKEAISDADVVYTDSWMSYHIPEAQRAERLRDLATFQVTSNLMKCAKPDALFMHCLPAQRGVEVTDEVIDSPQSVVFDQAENRLHSQKAILLMLLGEEAKTIGN